MTNIEIHDSCGCVFCDIDLPRDFRNGEQIHVGYGGKTAPCTKPKLTCHGLDTPEQVFFYEQDFYVLSNFSSFAVEWKALIFPTVEHAYHYEKFNYFRANPSTLRDTPAIIRNRILDARSAHDAFKIARDAKEWVRDDWDAIKVETMRSILLAKIHQHPYVRQKLLATGNRELVENSWRDDFWGWGPYYDGTNMLGRLWMEIRRDLRSTE